MNSATAYQALQEHEPALADELAELVTSGIQPAWVLIGCLATTYHRKARRLIEPAAAYLTEEDERGKLHPNAT